MFDGVPHEQLHQFIGSSRATSNPLPLVNPLPLPLSSFHLHHNHIVTSTNSQTIASNSFDSYSHHQLLLNPLQQQQQFIHPILHHKRINVNNNNNTIGDKQEQRQQQQEVNNNNSRNSTEGLVSDVDLDQIERETPTIMEEPMNSVNAVDEPWSNDEVVALLRIRSTMESWFPDFTWEHVSRKLAEHGFKMRSGEKCKEKYEEENRYFNNINNCTKNLRPYFLSDLEELYNTHTTSQQNPSHNHHQDNNNNSATNVMGTQKAQTTTPVVLEKSFDHIPNHDQIHGEIFGAKECSDHNHNQKLEELEDHKALETTNNNMKKRKRSTATSNSTKFEMFKGFCEDIVNKLMAQQEEMHNKLLEDMVKRDQEKLKKEEAWKKSEMDRMNKELEIMAREQAVAGARQAAIIDFLRKFSSNPNPSDHHHHHEEKNSTDDHHRGKNTKNNIITGTNSPSTSCSLTTPSSSSSLAPLQSHPNDHQNPNNNVSLSSSSTFDQRNPSSSDQKKPQNQNPSPSPAPGTNDVVHEDLGKRWPRDEVLALINLRCSLYENNNNNNNGDQQNIQSPAAEQSAAAKSVPLWERISQGMGEMGYKRSAKRCKEKWENINKYFRKTKDVNKKRSVDSRTCPYFHQLSTLYNKGTLHDQNNHDQDMMMIHDHHLDLDLDHDHDNQR